MFKTEDALVVGFDDSGNEAVMVVGRAVNGHIHFINEFTGDEARQLHNRLMWREYKEVNAGPTQKTNTIGD